jgi:hypothetical protein
MLNTDSLKKAHDRITALLCNHASLSKASEWEPWRTAEPYEAALVGERYRDYWKPNVVKLILLAESHLFTDTDDLACRIDPSKLPNSLPNCPTEFVRLVYCLGYGDNDVFVADRIPAVSNPGTDDYWEILSRCAETWMGSTGDLRWKLRTLQKLQEKGIWLLDASIHACCNPRLRQRPYNLANRLVVYQSMLRISWEYVGQNLRDCPSTWCIGHNVKNALPDSRLVWERTILQPSAQRYGRGDEYRKGLLALVTAANSL